MKKGRKVRGAASDTDAADSFQEDSRSQTTSQDGASPIVAEGNGANGVGDIAAPVSKKARRTTLTRNACIRCRTAKSKCNGKHPSCERCQAAGARCVYDVTHEGVTRMQNLQYKLESKARELDQAMIILGKLRTGSDHEAAEILARLRLGESIQSLVEATSVSPNVAGEVYEEADGFPDSFEFEPSFGAQQGWPSPSPPYPPGSMPYLHSAYATVSTPNLPLPTNHILPSSTSAATAVFNSRYMDDVGDMNVTYVSTVAYDDPSYRHLPQVTFNGAMSPNPAVSNYNPTLSHKRSMPPPSPRRKVTRTYSGFLWPCSSGGGMPAPLSSQDGTSS